MKKIIQGTKKNGHGRLSSTFLIAEVANNTQHPYLVLLEVTIVIPKERIDE